MKRIFLISLTVFFLLLPFHAFGVTALNALFFNAEFSAPSLLKAWKEIFLLIFFIGSGIYFLKNWKKFLSSWDKIDSIILCFSLVMLIVSAFNFENFSQLLYGIKYDLFPIWLFFCLRKVFYIYQFSPPVILGKAIARPRDPQQSSSSKHNSEDKDPGYLPLRFSKFRDDGQVISLVAYSGIAVVFFGFLFLLLPSETLVSLGYSPDNSFHAIQRPLAYCQKISFTDICRAQSTLSGPNQLGAFLLFLIPLFLHLFHQTKKYFWLSISFVAGLLLLLTFSRGAWVGGFVAVIFFLWQIKDFPFRKIFLSSILIFPILVGIFAFIFTPDLVDKIINRAASSNEHYEKTMMGINFLIENPLGIGLGSAGAASKFSGLEGTQGIIPENWYLQIGIEGGFISIILFLALIIFVFWELKKNTHTIFLASTFLGISITALFLHSWESATVAYIVWGIAGITISKKQASMLPC